MQEEIKHDMPWRDLVSTILLGIETQTDKCTGAVRRLFEIFDTPKSLAEADHREVVGILSVFSSSHLKAYAVIKISEDWLNGKKIVELYEVGEYGNLSQTDKER